MTSFIAIAIGMILVAAAFLMIPLLRSPGNSAPVSAAVIALALPAATVVLYLLGSNYAWQEPARMVAENSGQAQSMDEAIEGLKTRLNTTPDDLDGWLLLGNAYLQTRRLAEAEQAFGNALMLGGGEQPQARLGLAEARVLADPRALEGEAGEWVESALAAMPDNPKALWYGGLAALARQDLPAVTERWNRLLTMNPPDAVRRIVVEQLAAIGAGPAPGASVAGQQIDVTIAVADAVSARIPDGALLFLVARDGDKPGPPVAAVRESAAGLPRTLSISDANAMLPGRSLGQLEDVRLIARISGGGDALAQPGDLFGEARWRPGDPAVNILIDQVVQP